MQLLTKALRAKLISNGAKQRQERHLHSIDFQPVVKFFYPCGAATWLISEIVEEDGTDATMFGLCDLGMGSPELGYVSLSELQSFKGRMGLGIERDLWFKASKPLSEYAADARDKGRIAA